MSFQLDCDFREAKDDTYSHTTVVATVITSRVTDTSVLNIYSLKMKK